MVQEATIYFFNILYKLMFWWSYVINPGKIREWAATPPNQRKMNGNTITIDWRTLSRRMEIFRNGVAIVVQNLNYLSENLLKWRQRNALITQYFWKYWLPEFIWNIANKDSHGQFAKNIVSAGAGVLKYEEDLLPQLRYKVEF